MSSCATSWEATTRKKHHFWDISTKDGCPQSIQDKISDKSRRSTKWLVCNFQKGQGHKNEDWRTIPHWRRQKDSISKDNMSCLNWILLLQKTLLGQRVKHLSVVWGLDVEMHGMNFLILVIVLSACQKYTLKYSGMPGHPAGNLLLDGSGKNYLHCICNFFVNLGIFKICICTYISQIISYHCSELLWLPYYLWNKNRVLTLVSESYTTWPTHVLMLHHVPATLASWMFLDCAKNSDLWDFVCCSFCLECFSQISTWCSLHCIQGLCSHVQKIAPHPGQSLVSFTWLSFLIVLSTTWNFNMGFPVYCPFPH